MLNFFLYYGVNNARQLIISCYHNDLNAKIAFKNLDKNATPTRITGPLLNHVDEIATQINAVLNNLLSPLATTYSPFRAVLYSGDVNLGFCGFATFPPFLLDGSLFKFFKEHPLTKHAPVRITLDSANKEIAQQAAQYHANNFAQHMARLYPESSLVIKIKAQSGVFYCATSPSESNDNSNGDRSSLEDESDAAEISIAPNWAAFFVKDRPRNPPQMDSPKTKQFRPH